MLECDIHSLQTIVNEEFILVDQCIRDQLHSDVVMINKIVQYVIQSGGKRIRPLLVLLTARISGFQGSSHILLAAIIEFLHTATLLHDDVIDQSNLRRGRDTANVLWGNASSVLIGDFLYSRAFQLLVSLHNTELLQIFADATNVIAEGEVMQLMNMNNASVTEAQYMDVIRCKTAMLFEASTHTAAVIAGVDAEIEKTLKEYGHHLGMAFQLMDDLLDYTGDSQSMGKNLGDDLAGGKPTLPLIFTLAKGSLKQRQLVRTALEQGSLNKIEEVITAVRTCEALDYTAKKAREQSENAIICLKKLPTSEHRDAMEDLARFAITRTY